MSAGAEHINMVPVHINGELSVCLHRIRVKQNAMAPRDFTYFFNGLQSTDLIVGKHHTDQYGVRPDGGF